MKKIFYYILFLIAFLFIVPIIFNNSYHLKIEIEIKNSNPQENDENYARNLEIDLSEIKQIKNMVFYSTNNGISVYFKFKKFANKNNAIQEIEQKLKPYNFKNIKFDDKYNLNYNCFIIIHSNNNYYKLKEHYDKILEKILKSKIANKVKPLGLQQKTVNIYLSINDLLKYDLTFDEIKKIIQNNNIKNDYLTENTDNEKYNIILNSKIKNINDIKNIKINFKNSTFQQKFEEIFEIKQEIKTPIETKISYNDCPALILAISKKFLYPYFLIKFHLRNEKNITIINPKKFKKTEILLNENSNINSFKNIEEKIINKNNENYLLLYGLNSPKLKNSETFDEIESNRLIIFSNKKINYNFSNQNNSQKEASNINYKINDNKLNDYFLLKEDILNSFLFDNEGIFCDYFFEKNDKIEIYLKNIDQNDNKYIYSKHYKTLIDRNSILEGDYIQEYNAIIRKNFKIKNQKPFFK